MNASFFGFTPFAHATFYAAILMIAVAVVVGTRQWRRVRRNVVKQFENRPLVIMAACEGFVFACMYMVEARDGIIAWHENGAAAQHADAALTVAVGLGLTFATALVLCTIVLYAVARVASLAKCGKLHQQLDDFLQEQEIREIRRRQAKAERMARRWK